MRPAELLSRLIDRCYLPPLRRIMPAETFRYAACGGLNMAADAVWYCMIYHFVVAERFFDLGVVVLSPHIAAMLAVFPITFFTGFWLNRHVAFRTASQPAGRQLFRYALSIVGSVLLTYGGLKFFVEVCGWWPTPSKLLTTAVTVVYSYLAARHFTFTGKRESPPSARNTKAEIFECGVPQIISAAQPLPPETARRRDSAAGSTSTGKDPFEP